jgi:hypothetical protein
MQIRRRRTKRGSPNQGIRQILVGRFLEIGRDADAAALLKTYKDDGSAWMVYARALAAFSRGR